MLLSCLGARPEDIDTVLITHAHFDHMDNLQAFPNARFYVQRREIEGYAQAVKDPLMHGSLGALKPENIDQALELVQQKRMQLVDGWMEDVLPGVDLIPMYDGHTLGSQIVLIEDEGGPVAFIGDVAYLRESFDGIDGSGTYIPTGMAYGEPMVQVRQMDEIVRLVHGHKENIVLGHSMENWTKYETRVVGPLHISRIR